MRLNHVLSATGLVLVIGTVLAADATAATRNLPQNAVGRCQTALPVFDGQVRKRPLAIQNEGTSNAFVTCAFETLNYGDEDQAAILQVRIYASVHDGVADTLTCTGVSGRSGGPNQYVIRQVALSPNGERAALTWNFDDFAGGLGTFPSAFFGVSCNLNPGVGLNDTHMKFTDSPPV